MSKSTHYFGQPVYEQLIKSLNKDKIVEMSRNHGGERYIKSFDGWHHLLTMLYAVILRFDSLREIEASMLAEVRKLGHLGLKTIPRRSTLSDANSRRSEKFFEDVYRDLYEANKATLSSDSRRNGTEAWVKRLRIIDSTTISLFSNLIIRGVGRHPKTVKKKGGTKVHTVISANKNVPCNVKFTSATTHDSFMLAPSMYSNGEIVAMDWAYINYEKFEELTERNVVYVTKLKKNLVYDILEDCMDMDPSGKMLYREQVIVFRCECTSLTNIEIPDSITEIEEWAFSDCASLTSIEIPNSVIKIEEGAFCDCQNLFCIIIPNLITTIEGYTFAGCTRLNYIYIPNSVTTIGEYAFWGYPNLKEIQCRIEHIENVEISANAFMNCKLSKCTLYVPVGTEYAYRHHPIFSQFKDIVEEK